MAWMIVLSKGAAAEWVLECERMAFHAHVDTRALAVGEPFVIYVSRAAFRNPKRDEAQIVAVGRLASSVVEGPTEVGGRRYDRWCSLKFESRLPLRAGLAFKPLIEDLKFISNKAAWSAYLRRTIVPIPTSDFELIRSAFLGQVAANAGR